LDEAGWTSVDELLSAMRRHGRPLSREQLELVVHTNDKRRFAFSEDGTRIRANQGHSVEVDLGYESAEPPEILFHGTPERFVPSILREGLNKGDRHHVHLHADPTVAKTVGKRRGKPVILVVRAKDMKKAGHEFFVTPNRVWLTDHVPPSFIELR
jgi:putative RNA 2'-phosphotransferase